MRTLMRRLMGTWILSSTGKFNKNRERGNIEKGDEAQAVARG